MTYSDANWQKLDNHISFLENKKNQSCHYVMVKAKSDEGEIREIECLSNNGLARLFQRIVIWLKSPKGYELIYDHSTEDTKAKKIFAKLIIAINNEYKELKRALGTDSNVNSLKLQKLGLDKTDKVKKVQECVESTIQRLQELTGYEAYGNGSSLLSLVRVGKPEDLAKTAVKEAFTLVKNAEDSLKNFSDKLDALEKQEFSFPKALQAVDLVKEFFNNCKDIETLNPEGHKRVANKLQAILKSSVGGLAVLDDKKSEYPSRPDLRLENIKDLKECFRNVFEKISVTSKDDTWKEVIENLKEQLGKVERSQLAATIEIIKKKIKDCSPKIEDLETQQKNLEGAKLNSEEEIKALRVDIKKDVNLVKRRVDELLEEEKKISNLTQSEKEQPHLRNGFSVPCMDLLEQLSSCEKNTHPLALGALGAFIADLEDKLKNKTHHLFQDENRLRSELTIAEQEQVRAKEDLIAAGKRLEGIKYQGFKSNLFLIPKVVNAFLKKADESGSFLAQLDLAKNRQASLDDRCKAFCSIREKTKSRDFTSKQDLDSLVKAYEQIQRIKSELTTNESKENITKQEESIKQTLDDKSEKIAGDLKRLYEENRAYKIYHDVKAELDNHLKGIKDENFIKEVKDDPSSFLWNPKKHEEFCSKLGDDGLKLQSLLSKLSAKFFTELKVKFQSYEKAVSQSKAAREAAQKLVDEKKAICDSRSKTAESLREKYIEHKDATRSSSELIKKVIRTAKTLSSEAQTINHWLEAIDQKAKEVQGHVSELKTIKIELEPLLSERESLKTASDDLSRIQCVEEFLQYLQKHDLKLE